MVLPHGKMASLELDAAEVAGWDWVGSTHKGSIARGPSSTRFNPDPDPKMTLKIQFFFTKTFQNDTRNKIL